MTGSFKPPIILASASKTRATLLQNAGIPVICEAAHIDEEMVKETLAAEGANAVIVAETLAEMKAQRVSQRHPEAIVIGGDQTLECEGQWFDKPDGIEGLRAHMKALRGRIHRLNAAVCVVKEGKRLWHMTDPAEMTMWLFDNDFMEKYIEMAGPDICDSVGGYRLEGIGAQLFSAVKGDYFTVLGLPLLPLIGFLRANKVI